MNKSIIICVIFCAFLSLGVQGQSVGTGVEINVQNNNDFTGFEMLDSAIRKARVVMTGENHTYVKFNSKMELKMLRMLNEKTGTRNFIIELGAARAHFINRYINESDTMADRYLRATTSPRYMDLFKRMRKFNRSLPDSLKIRVWGIDVERFNDLPLIRLAELMPGGADIPKELRVGVDAVHGAADWIVQQGLKDYEMARDETKSSYRGWGFETQPFYLGITIREFIRYYDSLKPAFQTWLGAQFSEVEQAVGWLKEYQKWKDYENTTYQYVWREENIYRNLSGLVSKFPAERFYGQFGRCHVAYEEQNGDCGWYGYHSVINKMQTRYFKSKDSLLTIGLFYSGNGDNNYYSDREDDKTLQTEIDQLLESATKKAITLYNLNDEDAELPRLANKFSFAVVNDKVDPEDDEDSTESDIISVDEIIPEVHSNSWFFGLGYTWTTINMDILGNHIANNGYATELKPIGFQDIFFGYNGWLTHETRLSAMADMDLHENDSGVLRYNAWMAAYRIGYPLVNGRKLQFNIGLSFNYASEKIKLENNNTSFLQTRQDREFVHRAFVAGPSAQLNYKLGKFFFAGIHCSKMYDFSQLQWNYKGSAQPYGPTGNVSAGFGAYYISGVIGMVFPIPDYSDNYYD